MNLWKITGKGSWAVDDYSTTRRYLFKTKKEATAFSLENNLSKPYKRG
jgi:hypothetical protein